MRTFDREIVERGNVFEFRKRPAAALWISGLSFLAALGFYVPGSLLRSSQGDYGTAGALLRGTEGLIGILALFALAGAFVAACSKRLQIYAVLDGSVRILRFGGRIIPWEQIRSFEIAPFGDRFVSLLAIPESGESLLLWTAAAAQRPSLQVLADRFNGFLRAGEHVPTTSPQAAFAAEPHRRRLIGRIALVVGGLWALGGYFFFKGLFYVSPWEPSGLRIPLWWTGFVFILIGLYIL